MKIVRQSNSMYKEFSEINIGEVFDYCGEIYMCIDEIMDSTYNAINLKTAKFKYFSYDDEVLHYPQAKIVLTD